MKKEALHAKWHSSACILCSINCGIEVQVDDGHLTKIRGDDRHPLSRGYLCQKAARLDYYQNNSDLLQKPLRKKTDGSFEEISWETAISEIAAKLVKIRDVNGGSSLAYYGGGGQGNHLGGMYAVALRMAMKTRYCYSALAQEKTGDFWVNGKLFGRQTSHITEDIENAELVVFIGTNPWQAHGITRARDVLRKISKDPQKTMIVIDPVVTETARMADLHLQVHPGTDAYLLAAILSIIVQKNLVNREFIEKYTTGFNELEEVFGNIPIDKYAKISGVALEKLEEVAQKLAKAKAACIRVDLGLQQSLHSTLNSYLEKLLFLLTGNLGNPGSNNFHTIFVPLTGHSKEEDLCHTKVTNTAEIGKLFPPNVLPVEIDSDHPQKTRGLIVDSANPVVTGADTQAYRKAFDKLELLVVIDVAMSETAQMAHYVLPAATQFEKWEATFFTFHFPANFFHLRKPFLAPRSGPLTEPEIYSRLVIAMGELPQNFPLLKLLAKIDRLLPKLRIFPTALAIILAIHPKWKPYASVILYKTLGKALKDNNPSAAALWAAAHFYAKKHAKAVNKAGIKGKGYALGEALFSRILESHSGMMLSAHTYEDTWQFIRHQDKKIHLDIPEMLKELKKLQDQVENYSLTKSDYPFILIAGERRSYNANTIYRNPSWRKVDKQGALKIHPEDAAELNVKDSENVICKSSNGEIEVCIQISDTMQKGVVSLPHGYGLDYADDGKLENRKPTGPLINLITSTKHCDSISKTPFHKNVPVQLYRRRI